MNLKLALTVSPSYLRLLLHKYIEHICITSIKMAIINGYSKSACLFVFFLVSFKYFPTRVLRRIFVWIPVQILPSHCDVCSGTVQRGEFLFAGSIKMCLTPKPPALIVILVIDCYPLKPIVIFRKWLSSGSESTGCSYSSQSIQCCKKKKKSLQK